MATVNNKNKKRLILFFALTCLTCTALAFRVGWIQVVASEKYANLAVEQQTRDIPIPAKRGIIYDRNGQELAISAVTHTVWVRPAEVKKSGELENTAKVLSQILDIDVAKVTETLSNGKSGLLRVAKYVDKEKADQIRNAELPGISIAEDVKRNYPLGAFAAHLLGSTTDDNRGLAGVELRYDKYLSGIPGRWIRTTDVSGKKLTYGVERYFQAENGLNAVLTVDEVIQHYVEKAIDQVQANTQAARVMCIVMDPKTGDILSMAITPDFDPNDPRTPTDPIAASYVESLSDAEKQNYWNAMWRNPLVSDTYEPGSTFKLITTAIALEEGVTNLQDEFNCTGYYQVADARLKCWRYYNPHGHETLVEAVQNSCNPVFIQLGQRLGVPKYYSYLRSFGFSEKTGIDYPGEGLALLLDESIVGPVELATISYGQGISVTPIQLLSAISALGNGGKLMEPRIVKELTDSDGNVIEKYEPKVVRQVVSKQTAEEMSLIMEAVVSDGTGRIASIPGYRVGGKTGTADKVINGRYAAGKVYSSFVAMAPMNDPRLAILLIVDEPQGVHFGSQTAAPGVKYILEESLRYLNVEPSYTQEEMEAIEKGLVMVPDLTGKTYEQAMKELAALGLTAVVAPAITDTTEFTIIDQYPKAGEKTQKAGTVYLYR